MKKKTGSMQVIKKVLKYLKKYWFLEVCSLLFAAASVVLTLYLPILIGQAVDMIIEPGSVYFESIIKLLGKMGIVIVATALLQWLMNTCNNKITYNVVRDIRRRAFEHIERLSLKYLDGHPSGDILSRIVADVDQFSDGLLMGFTQFFTGVMTIFGTLIFMVRINVKITLVVVLITPLSLFVAAFISKRTYDMFKLQSETRGEMTSHIDEMIGNQKVVQAFGYER